MTIQANSAIATFERITQLEPENPYGWTYLGFVNLYNWNGQKAQVALDQAANLAQLPELHTLNIVAALMRLDFFSFWQLLRK